MTLGHSIRMLGATSLVAVLAVMGACLTGCSPSPTPAPSSAQTGTAASQNKTNASAHAQGTNIALIETNSIFEDKRPGARDPFFPTSTRGLVKPPPPQGQEHHASSCSRAQTGSGTGSRPQRHSRRNQLAHGPHQQQNIQSWRRSDHPLHQRPSQNQVPGDWPTISYY